MAHATFKLMTFILLTPLKSTKLIGQLCYKIINIIIYNIKISNVYLMQCKFT